MTYHTLMLSEPHALHGASYSIRYFSTVDVYLSGAKWEWCQVDRSGKYVGGPSGSFSTEVDALDDALRKLGGDDWE